MITVAGKRLPFPRCGALMLAVAAGLMAMVPVLAHGEALGRLFFTPEQRAALDEERFASPREQAPEPEVVAEEPAPEPAPPVQSFRMEGLVVRSRGPNTAWVDGRPVLRRGQTSQGVTVDPGAVTEGGVAVRVPGSEASVDLKPGQRFDPVSARVSELAPGPGPGNTAPREADGAADRGGAP